MLVITIPLIKNNAIPEQLRRHPFNISRLAALIATYQKQTDQGNLVSMFHVKRQQSTLLIFLSLV